LSLKDHGLRCGRRLKDFFEKNRLRRRCSYDGYLKKIVRRGQFGIKESFRSLIVNFVNRVKDLGTAENNYPKRKSKA
jgi:hypothetical protein